jgi:hypothetical protein
MFNYDLHKLQARQGFLIFTILAGLFIAPFWYLFMFYRDLFMKIEFWKALLLAPGLSTPIIIINAMIYASTHPAWDDDSKSFTSDDYYMQFTIGSFITLIALYVPCAMKFFWQLSPGAAIITSIMIEVCVLVSMWVSTFKKNATKKQTVNSCDDDPGFLDVDPLKFGFVSVRA